MGFVGVSGGKVGEGVKVAMEGIEIKMPADLPWWQPLEVLLATTSLKQH
jgi:hypothetical protein